MESRSSLLYPMMIIAAISVILFSIVGIATVTGHMPSAFSQKNDAALGSGSGATPETVKRPEPRAERERLAPAPRVSAASMCSDCGVVESVRAYQVKGQGSGLGAVVGGVVGGLLGNQIGGGNGRVATTLLGAGGGAYLGNEIEKNSKQAVVYRVTVRMDDGSLRTLRMSSPPGFGVGSKVRVVNGTLVARG